MNPDVEATSVHHRLENKDGYDKHNPGKCPNDRLHHRVRGSTFRWVPTKAKEESEIGSEAKRHVSNVEEASQFEAVFELFGTTLGSDSGLPRVRIIESLA